MTAIDFGLAVIYLAYFYFVIDYCVEKEMLFVPLFIRGAGAVIISIVFLTSIVEWAAVSGISAGSYYKRIHRSCDGGYIWARSYWRDFA